jgi:hypothetical protein
MGQSPARWDEILISSNSLSSTTHRSTTAVGFLFPSLAAVHPNRTTCTTKSKHLKLEAHDLHTSHHHGLTALTSIYLEAGLPLDLAIQSAVADYELFEEELLCA